MNPVRPRADVLRVLCIAPGFPRITTTFAHLRQRDMMLYGSVSPARERRA